MMKKEYFSNSVEHLVAELGRIDLLIQLQVRRSRRIQHTDIAFQGLYISEQEIDDLLIRKSGLPRWAVCPDTESDEAIRTAIEQMRNKIKSKKSRSIQQNIDLRLEKLANTFKLTPFDIDILLICLAPEIDLRYERLYAYLQDDVTKKRPSVDLVLNLLSFSFEAKLVARERFTAATPLCKYDLIHLFDDPSQQTPPLLGKFLKINERIADYLHDLNEVDARLLPYVRKNKPRYQLNDLVLPKDFKRRLTLLAKGTENGGGPLILYFKGPYGVGKQSTAEALCNTLGVNLLTVHLEKLLAFEKSCLGKLIRMAWRETRLEKSALYFSNFDALLSEDNRFELYVFLRELERLQELTFLAGRTTWEPADALFGKPFVRVEFPLPVYADRMQLWTMTLNGDVSSETDGNLEGLASKFRFTGGQIRDAANTARNLALWRNPESVQMNMTDLYTASRLQSNRKLGNLARKIIPNYLLKDIVLPDDGLQQLQEICNYIKHYAQVYWKWGFDAKFSLCKGLSALFYGPSGSGKTMGAEVIAHELNLDLYKIDLSTVVSKYVGDTEKNLSMIFDEAETSNAVLFFDESDALFGKRSEVKDSHDRYANIEIGYLLQKLDEYTGVVILATNLKKNMDNAFLRRMHFTMEFPFPDANHRERIWQNIFPEQIPLGDDIAFDFLARNFKFSGGNIKNTALAAAFYAAGDGHVVTMEHLIHATKREFQKMGKLCLKEDFGDYYQLISEPDQGADKRPNEQ